MDIERKKESPDYIGDVGEKFEGAKKDTAQPVNFEFNNTGSDSQITKRKLWSRPNFREDVKGGLNTAKHAILFMIVYDNLNNKPYEYLRFSITSYGWEKAYKHSIEFLKNAYENDHYESIDKLTDHFNAFIRSKYPNSKNYYERYAAGKSTSRKVTHPLSLPMEARLRLDCLEALGWVDDEDVLDTDNYGACILTDTRTNKKSWYAVKGATAKSVSTLNDWVTYDTFDEAMAESKRIFEKEILSIRKNTPKPKKERSKPPKRPTFDRPFIRQGPNYRNDEPVSVEKFVETFRFRGIEFGNWVTQSERQGFLDATYDSFMDLSRIFKLPPTFASLGGTLGIAFGSRGKGADNVAAHFELDQWLIHLTKTKGVGALSHEFAHALDAYISKRNNLVSNFITENFGQVIRGRHPTVKHNLYFDHNKMKDRQMMPEFTDLLHVLLFADGDHKRKLPSNFCRNGVNLDNQTRKVYWADPVELFARAFESWMSDRLVEEGQINEFLVYGTDQTPSSWNTKFNMYPEGAEREKIVQAMDAWIAALVSTWKKTTQ